MELVPEEQQGTVVRITSRAVLPAVCLTILLVLLAACGAEEEAAQFRESPPAPEVAPSEVVARLASDPQFGGIVEPAPVGNPDITEGTPVAVRLQDPGGSGVYAYDPAVITVAAGEPVIFTLVSESEFHTFTISELGLDAQVEANESLSFGFQFDEPGTYSLVCIPHEALGMVGAVVVQ